MHRASSVRAPLARRMHAPLSVRALRPRAFTATAVGRQAPGFTPEDVERTKKLQADVTAQVRAGIQAMRDIFGEEHAEKVWQASFYRHKMDKFVGPAVALMCADPSATRIPSMAAKNAVFLSQVLRRVNEVDVPHYFAAASLTEGTDFGFLLAVAHLADTPASRVVFKKMAASIRGSGSQELMAAGRHIGSVPLAPAYEWPIPFADPCLTGMDVDPFGHTTTATKGQTGAEGPATLGDRWKKTVYPWEVTGIFAQAKDVLSFPDWLLLASTTVLEAQWAGFYATGDRRYLFKILDMAAHWAEFTGVADSAKYLISIQEQLPAELRPLDTRSPGAAAWRGDATQMERALRGVRAHVSRAAAWSLLHQSRLHKAVTEALAKEVGDLAVHMVSEKVPFLARGGVKAAAAVMGEGKGKGAEEDDGDSLSADVDELDMNGEVLRASYSRPQAMARLEVFPALLHLAARAVLDAPDDGSGTPSVIDAKTR